MASHHRFISDWNPDQFFAEALAIHLDVKSYIKHVMEEKKHPEQAYKSCRGILNFAGRVGHKRLINACRWASGSGLYNYYAIENILRNKLDELPLEENKDEDPTMPLHDNIRGKEYYN